MENKSEFKQKFSIRPEVEFEDNDFYRDISLNKTFPETAEDVQVRTIKVHQSLVNNTSKWSNESGKKICYLVVSHGALIDFMSEIYETIHETPLHEIQETEYEVKNLDLLYKVPRVPLCNYCSITGGEFQYDKEDYEMAFIPKFKRDSEHVKDLV